MGNREYLLIDDQLGVNQTSNLALPQRLSSVSLSQLNPCQLGDCFQLSVVGIDGRALEQPELLLDPT